MTLPKQSACAGPPYGEESSSELVLGRIAIADERVALRSEDEGATDADAASIRFAKRVQKEMPDLVL